MYPSQLSGRACCAPQPSRRLCSWWQAVQLAAAPCLSRLPYLTARIVRSSNVVCPGPDGRGAFCGHQEACAANGWGRQGLPAMAVTSPNALQIAAAGGTICCCSIAEGVEPRYIPLMTEHEPTERGMEVTADTPPEELYRLLFPEMSEADIAAQIAYDVATDEMKTIQVRMLDRAIHHLRDQGVPRSKQFSRRWLP